MWLMGKWVKYNEIFYLFIYLYLFYLRTHLQVRTVDGKTIIMCIVACFKTEVDGKPIGKCIRLDADAHTHRRTTTERNSTAAHRMGGRGTKTCNQ